MHIQKKYESEDPKYIVIDYLSYLDMKDFLETFIAFPGVISN